MKKFFLYLCLAIVCRSSALAQDANVPPQSSLFFTPQETREAERLAEKAAPAGGASNIRLGAVMYYGPGDWTLWLQGEKWTPGTVHENLHILEVSPAKVRLLWRGDEDSAESDITLRPNETYQIATGKVIVSP
jgi:hypothetical protein